MQKIFSQRILFWALAVVAGIFWGLAVFGAFQNYSPVPFWDMWKGYLDFYMKVTSGDWSSWWSQHNEHRILLARLFFWIDLAWFNGSTWFLLIVNYALMAFSCWVFWLVSRELSGPGYNLFGAFIVVLLTSWAQRENLTWGFQNQFFLAQLLPLVAFYMLHQATIQSANSSVKFFVACCFGVLSLGTMANGVLALPIMFFYTLVTESSHRHRVILLALSLVGLGIYFFDYHPVAHHDGSLSEALIDDPVGLLRYVFLYLGSPLFHIFGANDIAKHLALVAGFVFAILAPITFWRLISISRGSSIRLAMLAFILYIGGTALGTAGGRLFLGENFATSSRYTTPSLMAWAAMIVALMPRISSLSILQRSAASLSFLIFSLIMLPLQLTAVQIRDSDLFAKKIAALALRLRINDQHQISLIYPDADRCLKFSEGPTNQNLSIFGQKPFVEVVADQIGQKILQSKGTSGICKGGIDSVQVVSKNSQYLRLSGWFYEVNDVSASKLLRVTNNQNILIGYALLENHRPEAAATVSGAAANSGFMGYALANIAGDEVSITDTGSGCSLLARLKPNRPDN